MPEGPQGRAERASWLRIALTPGVGPIAAARLLGAFGLPEDILGASHAALSALVGPTLAGALLRADPEREAAIQQSLDWSTRPGCHLLAIIDPDYPAQLLQTADPPPLLWVQGRLGLLAQNALAIVGSRSATQGGMADAFAFAQAFGQHGLTVISGLALGIDAAAHRGALETAGGTVAVLGTGTDRIYPRQQAALAQAIARQGALVSELAPGTEPRRGAFPRRNRLIAGLSLGVMVVEAALQSGSLITARLATELGRDVFAMPGSIHSPTARGCHQLIRQGARLVESADDVLSELGWGGLPTRALAANPHAVALGDESLGPAGPTQGPVSRPNPSAEGPLLGALGWDPVDTDTLLQRLLDEAPDSAPAGLLERLVALELTGRVERLPDGRFKRLFK